jgi:hypothetical protein
MVRRPRDAEATRLEILDASEGLFAEQGYGSTFLLRRFQKRRILIRS